MRIIALMLLTWPLLATAVDYRTITGAGGVPLQIAESGDQSAPGILLIHGAALSSSSWLQQMNSSLAEDFHLVAFDLRGHGNSGKPWDPAQYSDSKLWADDVAAVMQATGLKHPVIVGWSYGGHVTMDYLRHYSDDRIAGIVFVGSTGGMQPFPPPDPETAAEFARIGALAMSPDAGARLEGARAFVDGMLVAPVPDALREREVASVLAVTPYARKSMQGRSLDNADLIERLKVPVLFIVGDGERAAPAENVKQLAERIPDAAVSVYANTGHMPFIEHEARFNAELTEFLIKTGRH